MKCAICGKEVLPDDPTYPNVHYDCSDQFYKEMEELKVIKVLSKVGTNISCILTDSFQKVLDRFLDEAHFFRITDQTVNDDLVDMQGVIKAVLNYLPKNTPPLKLYFCAELVFNCLMMEIYGIPVPYDKKFYSRMMEFMGEVTSIPVGKEEAEFYKAFFKAFKEMGGYMPKKRKVLEISNVSKELNEELNQAACHLLDIIEKICVKMEEDFGASKTWRSFRMDELLLQTMRDMILVHLKTAPSDVKMLLEPEDEDKLRDVLKSMFTNIAEFASAVAKRHNLPLDVVFVRITNEVIRNIANFYPEIKFRYAKV